MKRVVQRRATQQLDSLPAHLPPLLRRIYAGRRVASAVELDYSLENLHPASDLGGIEHAAALLEPVVTSGRPLTVVADYDADGATACALAIRGLRDMGAASVDYLVPDRFRHGYGLSPDVVDLAAARGPRMLMTVDNGISSIDGVARARSLGMEVIVTDHHLPGAVLPDAAAIINPNLPGDAFPSKSLAGVGVVFYVLAALRARLRAAGWFADRASQTNLAALLDIVALGTVADVVPLDHNNRILVAHGLQRIRAGRACPGIAALLGVAGREHSAVRASDLAFYAGPRLNAAGRLTDMSLGIECLLADDPDRAMQLATQLDTLNRERRQIQQEMQEQALADLAGLEKAGADGVHAGLCVFNPAWHAGVVGVLASRIKDQFRCPVIAFAPDDDGQLRGSGRSMPGVHIRDAIMQVANAHPGLVLRFGGHAMAAGLTIGMEGFDDFRRAFDAEVRRVAPAGAGGDVLLSDGELRPEELNLETVQMLHQAGPWGQGFPEPLFDGEFRVVRCRTVAEKHLKLSVTPPGSGAAVDAIAFNQADEARLTVPARVHLAYRLDANEYNGRRTLQLVVEQLDAGN